MFALPAYANKRIAVVIGNANYASEAPLANPINDASLIARTLRNDLRFDEVIERKNLNRKQMLDLLDELSQKARAPGGVDTVIVYYSGHGMQGPGGSYLLPVDADIRELSQVKRDGVLAQEWVDMLRESNARVGLLILDACRNNPFQTRVRSATKGLSRPTEVSGNVLVAYATREGDYADDGAGANSPYAAALAANLRQAARPVLEIFDDVSDAVRRQTGNRQQPTRYGDLRVSVQLLPGAARLTGSAAPAAPLIPSPGTAGGVDLGDLEKQARARQEWASWQGLMKDDFDKVRQFRASANATAALEIEAWERYLKAWPDNNPFSEEDEALRQLALSLLAEAKRAREAESQRPPASGFGNTTVASVGQTFRDCADCPEMVVIPAGRFTMGSPAAEAGRSPDEGPQHGVSVKSIAMGKTHITRGQFAAFVNATKYDAGNKCVTFEGGKFEGGTGRNWRNPGYQQADNHPVVCINWDDAKAYAKWLSSKTGKVYRLPTESEWEYAARAATTSARYWGENPDAACRYANVGDQTATSQIEGASAWDIHNCSDGYAYTAPVASFRPNAFGLQDMIGNVRQWVEDCWHADYNGAPRDGSAWKAGDDCGSRVQRGGSWLEGPAIARSAHRGWYVTSPRALHVGFRLARMLP
jgi:formylglycine-generating enzyme required for sulfatase activity/uncharacterized caspase-like protein